MTTPVGIGVLQEGFAEFYKFSKNSDCKIVCGSYTFDAHKIVLRSQSKYFNKALKSGTFSLGAAQDGADTSDGCDDPEIVKLMIEYFYLFGYGGDFSDVIPDQDHASPSTISKSYLIEHAKVFAMAVKHQADGLSELAAAKFKTAVTTHGFWEHEDFSAAISTVFISNSDDFLELRNTVEEVLHDHFDTLKAKEEFAAVMHGIPGLIYNLLAFAVMPLSPVKDPCTDHTLTHITTRPLPPLRLSRSHTGKLPPLPSLLSAPDAWYLLRKQYHTTAQLFRSARSRTAPSSPPPAIEEDTMAASMETLTALKAGFATLYESEAFSDCVVTCGPKIFNLHKAILSGQSEYFMKALQSGKFKEGNTGVIKLKATSDDPEHADDSCDAPEIVELMVEYFYHFDYLRTAAADGRPSLIKHAKVFAMAIKYQVDGLRALAAQKFKQAASTDWSSEDFAHVVHVVYASTPDHTQELREIVADTIYDHFNDLKDKEELEVVISGLGDLSYSLLRRTSSAFRSGELPSSPSSHTPASQFLTTSPPPIDVSITSLSMASPMDHHMSGLAKLHQSEEFSDCTLICGPCYFNLHKVILASQSDYFRAAFKHGAFKSDGETSDDGDDAYDEPEIVKLMVEYFYYFDYLCVTESLPDLSLFSPPAPELPPNVYIIEHAAVNVVVLEVS
ncbi:hypothetical protein Q7P35_004747 [Cladosporium inversicolor]